MGPIDVQRVVSNLVFRDWEITVQGPWVEVMGFFPLREEDDPHQREDSLNRWQRSRPGYSSPTGYLNPSYERYDMKEPISPYGLMSSYTMGDAVPVITRTAIPHNLYCERDIIVFLYECITAASDHEVRENLYYRGDRVMDPHLTGTSLLARLEVVRQ